MKLTQVAIIISASALLNSCFPELGYGSPRLQFSPNPNIPRMPNAPRNPTPINSKSLRANDIVRAVNKHRARIGRRVMQNNGNLAAQARNHSDYLLNIYNTTGRISVAHTGFNNRFNSLRGSTRITSLAENIAQISDNRPNPAQLTLNLWISSPGHNANLNKGWNITGAGVARAADGTLFITQLYGK